MKASDAIAEGLKHLGRVETSKRPTLHLRAKDKLYPGKVTDVAVKADTRSLLTKPKQNVYERASGLLYKK